MDKYEQIGKLAQAAMLIREVLQHADSEFTDALTTIHDDVADIADAIEGIE